MILVKDLGMQYPTEISKQKTRYGLYKCPLCSDNFKATVNNVNRGRTINCNDCKNKKNEKHGKCKTRLYSIWTDIKQRILNKKSEAYIYYGGRGIELCKEWEVDFLSFEGWALDNGYSDKLTLDRKDNDGNYNPSNCRWTNENIQKQNTRRLRKNNTTGYRGVSRKRGGFVCGITVNSKKIHIGQYDTAEEAGRSYDEYVLYNCLEHTTNYSYN